MLHPLQKFTFVVHAIAPSVFSVAIAPAVGVLTLVVVAIGEFLFSVAVLQEVFERASVYSTCISNTKLP